MLVEAVNTTAQPEGPQSPAATILPSILTGWPTWQYIVAALLGIVFYDQGSYMTQHNAEIKMLTGLM